MCIYHENFHNYDNITAVFFYWKGTKGNMKDNNRQIEVFDEDTDEIDLLEIFHFLKANLFKIILFLVVGAAAAFGVTKVFITPQYTATSSMYILSNNSGSVVDLSSIQISSQLKSDYQELVTSRTLLEDVINKLQLDTTYDVLQSAITVENPTDTRILNVSVTNPDPQLAADISNEISNQAKIYLPEIMKCDAPSVFEKARVPENPSSPSVKKNTMLGGLAFAVLYCAYLIVKFLMDDTFKTPEDINKMFGVQPIGMIPEGKIQGLKSNRRDKKRGGKSK